MLQMGVHAADDVGQGQRASMVFAIGLFPSAMLPTSSPLLPLLLLPRPLDFPYVHQHAHNSSPFTAPATRLLPTPRPPVRSSSCSIIC